MSSLILIKGLSYHRGYLRFSRVVRTHNPRRLGLEVRSGHPPPVPAEPLLCSRLSAKEELTLLETGRDGYRREGSVVGMRGIGTCPPHRPMMVAAVERRVCVARCLRCGCSGPAREDGVDAKQAFEEAFEEEAC
jgi:hypothetical protein